MNTNKLKGIAIMILTTVFGAVYYVMIDYLPTEGIFTSLMLIPVAVLGAGGFTGVRLFFTDEVLK